VPLPGLPWSPEFMEARERAMKQDWTAPEIGSSKTLPGTVNAALVGHYQTSAFTGVRKVRSKIAARSWNVSVTIMATSASRQHIKSGKLSMRRQKTNVAFDIPVLPELVAELELHPKTEQLAFLVTEHGKPFTAAGFGDWFRNRCDEAGLHHCSAHGLRKAAAVRHALNGATAPELMRGLDGKQLARRNATLKRRTESNSPRAPARRSFPEQELANRKTSLPKMDVSH